MERSDIDCLKDSPKGEAKPNHNRIKEQQLGLFSDRVLLHAEMEN
jgi:hypothetical protein